MSEVEKELQKIVDGLGPSGGDISRAEKELEEEEKSNAHARNR